MLPQTLFVQEGEVGNQNLFVNRTHGGAIQQQLGTKHVPGQAVGVYRLERVVNLAFSIVETPVAEVKPDVVVAAPGPTPAPTPADEAGLI